VKLSTEKKVIDSELEINSFYMSGALFLSVSLCELFSLAGLKINGGDKSGNVVGVRINWRKNVWSF
jgi:hypothetical protein